MHMLTCLRVSYRELAGDAVAAPHVLQSFRLVMFLAAAIAVWAVRNALADMFECFIS